MTSSNLNARLHALAREIGRLRPDWRNPERFFEERDELRRTLHSLAQQVETFR